MPRRPKRVQEIDDIIRPDIHAVVSDIWDVQIRLDVRRRDQERDPSRLGVHLQEIIRRLSPTAVDDDQRSSRPPYSGVVEINILSEFS